MKPLLNTLFVTSEDLYLTLDGENVVANRGKEMVARYPLHTLQNIVSFSYAGASPVLMGACAKRDGSVRPAGGFWPESVVRAAETSCCAGLSTGRRTIRPRAAASPGA